jgi:tRNA A-37 threonylcarbamoyl transferase component Bud32
MASAFSHSASDDEVTLAGATYRDIVQHIMSECQAAVTRAFEISENRCEVVGSAVTLETGATITLGHDDVVIAKTKRDASSFCNKKAKFRFLAGVEGMATAEVVVISGIPMECRDRVVVYERLGRTLDSMSRSGEIDERLAYTLSAEMLELVRKIHNAGFVHSRLSLNAFGMSQNGNLVLGALDSVTSLYDNSGLLDSRHVGGLKMDLERLQETIETLIGRGDVYEALVLDIDRSSLILGRPFRFGKWIDILRAIGVGEEPEFERAPRGHIAVADTETVALFTAINGDCLTMIPEDLPSCLKADGCACPPVSEFEAAGLQTAKVMNPDSRRGDFSGEYGAVFKLTSKPRAVMKIYSDDRLEEPQVLCSEKSMLMALDGLNGLAPRIFEITNGVHEACKIKSFVMEHVGNDDIIIEEDLWRKDEPVFHRIVARMLEILRDLHELGFIHADAHVNNWKLDNEEDIEGGLKLIDFGLSRPYVDAEGRHLVDNDHASMLDRETSRREDMKKIAEEVKSAAVKGSALVAEFVEEMETLGREERPNYEKWIALFRSLTTI